MFKSALSFAVVSLVALSGCSFGQKEADAPLQLHSLARPDYAVADEPDDATFHVHNKIVVDFKDGTTQAQIDAEEAQWGIDLTLANDPESVESGIADATLNDEQEEIETELLDTIRQDPLVEAAEPEMKFNASFVPNDPDYGKQWNLQMINMPKAWETAKGKGAIVAVLDTGIAYEDYDEFKQVPDLKGIKFVEGYDFVNNNKHANDDHGHGTHVAGTIAQATNNKEGVAGVAFEAQLMPVKVLDQFGSGYTTGIADAIRWAADHGANVINMSLGGGGRSAIMENAVNYARKKGVVVVCAAGNGGRGVVEYPAAYPGSVAVVAVGPGGTKAPYSSWGKEADISAPGGDKSQGNEAGILQNTIDPKDPSKSIYAYYQGTSMATPHVAGIAALLFSAGAKNPDQVEKALFASAHPPKGASGWSEQYGHGVVDADAALKALKKMQAEGDDSVNVAERPDTTEPTVAAAATGDDTVNASWSFPPVNWKPLVWGAALLAFVLLTLGKRERPTFFGVAFKPAFLIPFGLVAVGLFFLRWLLPASETSVLASSPVTDIIEWLRKLVFGRGTTASPIVYSAAIPIVLSLFAIGAKSFRPVVGGVAIGFAAILGYSAWAAAPALAWLPFSFLALPWLVVNALICLFVARAMIRKET
ncbi:MAG: S8 family serine peptidase [Myxococcaceae bacterium]